MKQELWPDLDGMGLYPIQIDGKQASIMVMLPSIDR